MIIKELEKALETAIVKSKASGRVEHACIEEINRISPGDVRGVDNPVHARILELDAERRKAMDARRAALREASAIRTVLAKVAPLFRKED